jgi:hypothetical protein
MIGSPPQPVAAVYDRRGANRKSSRSQFPIIFVFSVSFFVANFLPRLPNSVHSVNSV